MMGVVEPTGVWEVDLTRGDVRERAGTLALEAEALVFRPETEGGERRILLASIVRVRRLVGSPVLMVRHAAGAVPLRTAYYFVEPPPLRPADDVMPRPLSGSLRRRTRRDGVRQLAVGNVRKREELRSWERALREAIARR